MRFDWEIIRTVLTASFGLILLVMLYRRIVAHFGPQPPPVNQAWLMDLRVHYHPTRLEADVAIPLNASVTTEVLNEAGEVLKSWDEESLSSGNHTLKRPLEGMDNGIYAFRISTGSQATNRRFRLIS